MRTFAALLVLSIVGLPLHAGDEGIAGNWKLVILEDGQLANPWLVHIANQASKWTAEAEGLKDIPETKLSNFKVDGDLIRFELKLANRIVFQFEGKAPRAGAKKVLGSITRDGKSIPAYLEATAAKNGFELDRELLTRSPNDPRVFSATVDLILQAKEKNVAIKDVQEWVDTVLRTAESYGPRFQSDYTLRLVEVLSTQKDLAPLSTAVAAKAEALLDPKASPYVQLRFLTTLGAALKKAGTPQQIKDIEARIEKLEESSFADYAKNALDFKTAKFAGRKSKSDRAVLVELFTGAMCPPCVAADLAFDALEKTYSNREVVLLQYHLPIPGPDALMNADTEKRSEFYGRSLRGTPTIFLSGKADMAVQGGGGREDAADKYTVYREAVDALLEKRAGAKVQVRATRNGDKVAIQASVSNLEKPGETTRLRLALVEDWVRYKSRNGMLYHHRVVRALPGGAAGMALTKKDAEHAVAIDLHELRTSTNKYLDDFAKNESPFPDAQRPMRMRNLRVVAFVQNDDSYEVLQAAEAVVEE